MKPIDHLLFAMALYPELEMQYRKFLKSKQIQTEKVGYLRISYLGKDPSETNDAISELVAATEDVNAELTKLKEVAIKNGVMDNSKIDEFFKSVDESQQVIRETIVLVTKYPAVH